jgi:hypothetical protein
MARTKKSNAEVKVRRIIREELSGLTASLEIDPIYNASEVISHLDALLTRPDHEVNLNEIRSGIYSLRSILPEIIEEMNIIRDTFSD